MMLKRKNIVAVALSVLIIFMLSVNGSGKQSNQMDLPPVKKISLTNGVRVFYIEDELPVLTISVAVGYGQLYETRATAGLGDLIQRTLTICGSKKYPNMTLHQAIESIGGTVSITSSWEQTVISIKVLARFRNIAIDILKDLILNPNFNEKDFNTAKHLLIDSINRKYDDPATIAFEKARSIIFDGNCYGAVPEAEQVKKYTMSDITDIWEKYFVASNILVGVSTSIAFNEIKQAVSVSFNAWPKGKKLLYSCNYDFLRNRMDDLKGKIYLYKKSVPQATIVVGTPAPTLDYPGGASLQLMNYILGGGSFNSRLMQEIRVRGGMAYVVQSIVRPRFKTGVFLTYVQTGSGTVPDVYRLLQKNIQAISTGMVSKEELQWAKRSIANSYLFMFDTPARVLNNYLDIAYNGLPDDYYTTYLDRISGVSREDILSEGQKLFSDGLVTVIVGDASLKNRLKQFGDVVELN